MRKAKSVMAALVIAGGLATFGNGVASAAPTSGSYVASYMVRCATYFGVNECFELKAYTSWTNNQIWINGNVQCIVLKGDMWFTWCGVGGGNGTGTLNIGANYTFLGPSDYVGGYLTFSGYERMNIPASGVGGCTTFGSNSNVDGVSTWWNAGPVICKP